MDDGFEVKCLQCGSTKGQLKLDIGFFGTAYIIMECHECGNRIKVKA